MAIESIAQNSVVVANQVNPSIFTPSWCASQQLIPQEDLRQGTVIAPQLVQLLTDYCHLMVIPDRIQLTPLCPEDRQAEVVNRIVGGVVELLPHTPYSACGMNFTYAVRYPEGIFERLNREMLVHETVFSPFFTEPNARFGAYYSQDYFGGRLKLNVRPASRVDAPTQQYWQLEFNFHKDVQREVGAQQIVEFLRQWDAARALAIQIARATDRD